MKNCNGVGLGAELSFGTTGTNRTKEKNIHFILLLRLLYGFYVALWNTNQYVIFSKDNLLVLSNSFPCYSQNNVTVPKQEKFHTENIL